MKNILIPVIWAIAAFDTAHAQPVEKNMEKLTLRQCIEAAVANNLQVRQAAYQAQADKVNYNQAKGNRLPFITGNVSHGINQGRSIDPFTNSYVNQEISFANYSINTSITLWNGSSIQNNIKQNELNYQANEMNWQQAKDNITINVILAYLQVLNQQEQLSVAKKQVAVTQAQVKRLQSLHNSGAIAPATFYDMKGQLGADELTIVTIKNNLETAKISLAQLMNVSYAAHVELESINTDQSPSLYEGSPENIFQAATQQLALIKVVDLRQRSAQKGLLSAKAQRLPVLSLNGGLGTNYSSVASRQVLLGTSDVTTSQYVVANGSKLSVFAPQHNFKSQKITYGDQWKNNFNSSISIGLQIPILNGLLVKNRIKQAEITQARTAFEAQTTKTQLKQAIDQAYINMHTALERYQTLERQVADFTLSFKAAEVRFNAGANTVVEYMLAKNNVDRSRASLVSARYDYFLRVKILDFYQGKALW